MKYACQYGRMAMAELLIAAGAEVLICVLLPSMLFHTLYILAEARENVKIIVAMSIYVLGW